MRLPLLIFLILQQLSIPLWSQKNNFNLSFGGGPSYFLNDRTLHRRIDNNRYVGINYSIRFKKGFIFNPGIRYQVDNFTAALHDYRKLQVGQNVIMLNLDVLMPVSRHTFIRVGLWGINVLESDLSIGHSNKTSGGYYHYSHDFLQHGYEPEQFQTGFQVGIAWKVFKREHTFGINILHFASALVTKDYLPEYGTVGEDIKVLSVKARATLLQLSFEFNLKKRKKKVIEEEERQ